MRRITRVVEATTANIRLDIPSAHPNCISFVGVLAIREIVESITDFCVGRNSGQKGVEICLVNTICSVITIMINVEVV